MANRYYTDSGHEWIDIPERERNESNLYLGRNLTSERNKNQSIKIITVVVIVLVVLGVGSGLFVRFGLQNDRDSGSEQSAVNDLWKPWSRWGNCDVTCGVGSQTRSRECQESANAEAVCVGKSDESMECVMETCTVYGTWTEWNNWSSCNATCGDGFQVRKRSCQKTEPGLNCVGESSDVQQCNNRQCPVYGTWTEWNSWSSCNATCGNGFQTRKRSCQKTESDLDCVGESSDVQQCNDGQCPVYGTWAEWNSWSSCNATCGNGFQTRIRSCQKSESDLNCVGESSDVQQCHDGQCPVYGTWADWNSWSSCNATCGDGFQTRKRSCQKSESDLNCVGDSSDVQQCNDGQCPVYGTWVEWNSWSSCNATCGDGFQTRTRSCQKSESDLNCVGESSGVQKCDNGQCPVYGTWTDWNSWSSCNATCGDGFHTRKRSCQKTESDLDCVGESSNVQQCNDGQCPVYGTWAEWNSWSSCNATCGDGFQTRKRSCQKSESDLNCVGESSDVRQCNDGQCPVYGTWADWNSWSSCNATCGDGFQTRKRSCQKSESDLNCEGDSSGVQQCNDGQCPVYGTWTDWNGWSSCNTTCGDGFQTRNRSCQKTESDLDCVGESSNVQQCNDGQCPVYGIWAEWNNWSSCNTTCGDGFQTRNRPCQKTETDLDCVGDSSDVQQCNDRQCPVYGTWASWDNWSSCNTTCGDGFQTRNRACQMEENELNCIGESFDKQLCSNEQCQVDIATWASWDSWSICDVTCGQGVAVRTRECTRPNVTSGLCTGNSREVGVCNMDACSVYGSWTRWTSWGSCTTTCGGGIQTRTRSCQLLSDTDIDCVGMDSMQQDCNKWNCPDCSKTCVVGVLNSACDTCICQGTDIHVRTLTKKDKPLVGVLVYAASAPNTLLATSDGSGSLTLKSICVGEEIILTKEGFTETNVTLDSMSAVAKLTEKEYPRVTTAPASKYRLNGGDAKFCCVASGSPAITYYEWFKDDVLLDRSFYPNETMIELHDLTTTHSGQYRCRANSPIGAVFSNEASLIVRETSDAFCEKALVDKMITLPSDCVQLETNTTNFNVGTCLSQPCRNETSKLENSCSDTSFACCKPFYLKVNVQCTGYELLLSVVRSCVCSSCTLPELTISGIAIGSVSNQPLNRGQVYLNGEFAQYTSGGGSFSIRVQSLQDAQSVTLKLKDVFFNIFHDMIKVINIPGGSIDNIYVSIKMIQKQAPLVIQSDIENTLYGGSGNATNSSSAVTQLVIPPDSFYYDNGTKYNGSLSVVFTYLLPIDLADFEDIPGVFEFVNDDGETSQLETSGVFHLQVMDDDNNELSISESIEVTLTGDASGIDPDTGESTQLWGLNDKTGIWELLPFIPSKRRRRRQSKYVIGQVNRLDYYWRNCDIFVKADTCYFNPKVYTDSSLMAVTASESISLKLTYLFKRECSWCPQDISARWKSHSFKGPSCLKVFCSGMQSVIELKRVTSSSSISLIAKQPESNSVYSVTDSGRAVNIVMDTNNDNFFPTKAECEARTSDESDLSVLSFHIPGINEDVYTFNMFQLQISTISNDFFEHDWKSWCRETMQGAGRTQACAVRVHVDTQNINLDISPLQVRVTSKMGNAKPNFTDDIIGIREVHLNSSGIACVSYRCPTYIDGEIDQTKLVISVIGQARCRVVFYRGKDGLAGNVDATLGHISYEVFDADIEQVGLYKVDHGLFRQFSMDEDCIRQNALAKLDCSNGNYALVHFQCE